MLSQLPLQAALVRSVQRIRRKEVPAAPTKRWYLKEVPDRYKKTLLDEKFLLHPLQYSSEVEEEAEAPPRVIVFTTLVPQRNVVRRWHIQNGTEYLRTAFHDYGSTRTCKSS